MLKDANHKNLWTATAQPAPSTEALSGTTSADVVIIGAGYTGLSTALHLAEAGMKAVVVEARDIGHGGSGRNVGLVNAGMWVMPNDLIATQGEHWGTTLISALGDGPAAVFSLIERFGIACEPVHNGTLHLGIGASGYRELGERERQWQALGAPVRLWDRVETTALVGSDAFEGALLDQRAGTIQPLSYARGLATAALAQGAQIFTGTAVTDAWHENGTWTITTSNGAVIRRVRASRASPSSIAPITASRGGASSCRSQVKAAASSNSFRPIGKNSPKNKGVLNRVHTVSKGEQRTQTDIEGCRI